jgi:hypothetical protein
MAQWEVDDRHQFRSGAIGGNERWTAAAITMVGGGMIPMDGAAAMGNNGSTMDSGTVEQLRWAMRQQQCEAIAANAEAAQWEFGILDLCLLLLRSQLGTLPPAPDCCYSFGFS